MIRMTDVFAQDNNFESTALKVFAHQYHSNPTYQEFCKHLNCNPKDVKTIEEIPFIPISFFKTRKIVSSQKKVEMTFTSSGTTGSQVSSHHVTDLEWYYQSFTKGFEFFYGAVSDYAILALLPSYLEREGSSLILMAEELIKKSNNPHSGFYLNNLDELTNKLDILEHQNQKTLLIGVSFALLDLVEKKKFNLHNTIVMETGGMKGRRKEMIREELHDILKEGFGVESIHSEYGMTELLSQAYSKGNGIFQTPPWMKILIRDTEDALTLVNDGKTGGLNIIDLANYNSCSFIATQDLGKKINENQFEILGRFDHSDIRGCNLMVL